MTEPVPGGKIVTFYSYKGGTGRSMSLANVAWILASNGKRVLIVDWDIEAPGLHRYFHPFLRDKELTETEGLMDFVVDYASEAMTPEAKSEELPADWYVKHADIVDYAASLRWSRFQKPGRIDFVPAGRQCETYASTVNLFNWAQFYDKLGGGAFFEAAKAFMREEYDYILIDSRTGVSDTSGICTIQMPDTVVLCFTLNTQSIEGASAAAEAIDRHRRATGKEIRIFPMATRVERSEKEKVDLARIHSWRKFEPYLWHLTAKRQADYWGTVEVPYEPWYAFEEVLATFGDRSGQHASILSALEHLTSFITDGAVQKLVPVTEDERKSVVMSYLRRRDEAPPAVVDVATRGEDAMGRLTAAEQEQALDAILRLIRIPRADEATGPTRRRLTRAALGQLPERVFQALLYARIINVIRDDAGRDLVELAGDDVIGGWSRVQRAMESDRTFLRWRQELFEGVDLDEAVAHLEARPRAFTAEERGYIERRAGRRRRSRRLLAVAALIPLLIAAALIFWVRTDGYQLGRIYATAPVEVNDQSVDGGEALRSWLAALVRTGRGDEAQAIAAVIKDNERRALAYATLAMAFTSRGESERALGAVETAQTSASRLPAPDARAQTLADAGAIVKKMQPDSAATLYAEALRVIPPADPAAGRVVTVLPIQLVSLPGTGDDADLPLRRCRLLGRIAAELRQLEHPDAEKAADRALLSLTALPLATRVSEGLDLARQFDRFDQERARKARVAVIEALAGISPDQRQSLLVPAVEMLTVGGVTPSYEDLLAAVASDRFSPGERFAVTNVVTRALVRWPYAADDRSLWDTLFTLTKSVGAGREEEALAGIGAALAACGQPDRARNVLAFAVVLRRPTGYDADERARILSALAEAATQLAAPADAERHWKEAEKIVLTARRRADTTARVAVAGVACGFTNPALEVFDRIDDPAARADAAAQIVALAAERTPDPMLYRQTVLHVTQKLDDIELHDRLLGEATQKLVALGRTPWAADIAAAITNPKAHAEAIVMIVSEAQGGGEVILAGTQDDSLVRTAALNAIAIKTLGKNNRATLDALAKAAQSVEQIGTDTIRSAQRAQIAASYAAAGEPRLARVMANACEVRADRLRAYAAIITATEEPDVPSSAQKAL